jgi:hypothetical protein
VAEAPLCYMQMQSTHALSSEGVARGHSRIVTYYLLAQFSNFWNNYLPSELFLPLLLVRGSKVLYKKGEDVHLESRSTLQVRKDNVRQIRIS